MNNAMPALSSEATLLTVDVLMYNHASHAGVIITRDGLVVSICTIAQKATIVELETLVNGYRYVNEKVVVKVYRNKR